MPTDSLERIIKCIANYAMSQKPEIIFNRQFTIDIDSFSDSQLDYLVRLLNANRVTLMFYELLKNLNSPNISKLKDRLKPSFNKIKELEGQRDDLLRRLADVFDDMNIDYVVFKTLNASGWIGVDIDIMIELSSYERCIDALLRNGFYAIDDLSKKYATGFMVKGNPIIVDLHTELAVLGVRYMCSDLLLRHRHCKRFQPSGSDLFALNVLDETMEALVRMVHSVLKEGTVTIAEVAEVLRVFSGNPDLMIRYIDEENFQLSAAIFSYAAKCMLNEQISPSIKFNESFTHSLARSLMANSVCDSLPPFKLQVAMCVLAFLDHLKSSGEIGNYLPSLVNSFRFKRNTAYIGRKILLLN